MHLRPSELVDEVLVFEIGTFGGLACLGGLAGLAGLAALIGFMLNGVPNALADRPAL